MENSKKCYCCKKEKNLESFYKCKRDKKFGKNGKCKECCKEYSIMTTEKRKVYYKENYNLEKEKERVYNWRIEKYGDFKVIREQKKIEKQLLKEQKEKERIFNREVLLPLKKTVRTRLWCAFKVKKLNKKDPSISYLCCDYNFLVKHIESQFIKGMNWDNKFLWHIDHIVPLKHAKTEKELITLCHYSNLQPLWANENIKKRGIIPQLSNIFFKITYP